MPLLIDGDEVVPESSIIIEHLQLHHAGPMPLIPSEPKAALQVRLLDRMSDNDLMTPMQKIVAHRMQGEEECAPFGVAQARTALDTSYAWWDAHMANREWATHAFSLADCATATALFYADWVHPIPTAHAALRDYRRRLRARPSVARAVDQAHPFRSLFPFGDPGRD